ncbi:MAG TPA: 50S ribosomal protein L11 methyltransferase [Pseudolabrys sp.]|nr:50S ribosomal protein L11 methyltransferase [Pseudolabrys sp.]
MKVSSSIAHLHCDQLTAHRIARILDDGIESDAVAYSAVEGDDGCWQVAVHFRDAADQARIRELITLAAGKGASEKLVIEQLAAKDWVATSLAGLTPVRAGRFIIHGAHDRTHLRAHDVGIEIEAALAFGTGHHGTTRGCLAALSDLAKRGRRRKTLDVGTGTGVLAIASALAFRTRVVATDIDKKAVEVARLNLRRNRTAAFVTLVHAAGINSPVVAAGGPYDLITANILLKPLTSISVSLRQLASSGARIILSGLLPTDVNAALPIYRAQGLFLEKKILLDGWATLVLRRRTIAKKAGRTARHLPASDQLL